MSLSGPSGAAWVSSTSTEPSLGRVLLKRAERKGMADTRSSRDYEYDWTHANSDSWMERAACDGMSGLFTHKSGFAKAVLICRSCPVIEQCGKTATREDFAWTVRAGEMPTSVSPRNVGRPTKGKTNDLTCLRGHVGEVRINEFGQRKGCRTCDREKKQARHEPKPRVLKNTCKNGHTGQYEYEQREGGKRFCRACRRINARRYEKERSARMKA